MAKLDKDGHLIYDKISLNSVIQANYLASMQDDSRVDDVINIYTGLMPWNKGTPPCSHTEIGFWVDGELWFFSSTTRKELGANGETGTRWRKGTKLLHNPDRWLLQERVHHAWKDLAEKIDRANSMIGLKYDFTGVFTDFVIPWAVWKEKDLTPELLAKLKKIYCSKAVHVVDTGKLAVYSPKRQYTWATENRYKIIIDTAQFMVKRGQVV